MKNKGFTLIELVVVIAVIGTLAAIAIPRFISIQAQGRIAVLNGMVGALQSATMLSRASYKIQGNSAATTAPMDGAPGGVISVVAGFDQGQPTCTAAGIQSALAASDGFTFTACGGDPGLSTFQLQANCSVTYDTSAASPPAILTNIAGC